MCKSVNIRIIEFSFVINKDCHSVVLVEVQYTSLTGLPHTRAAAHFLHLVQPDGEDHGVTGRTVHVQHEEINSTNGHRELSRVNVQPPAQVYIGLRQTIYPGDNYREEESY